MPDANDWFTYEDNSGRPRAINLANVISVTFHTEENGDMKSASLTSVTGKIHKVGQKSVEELATRLGVNN